MNVLIAQSTEHKKSGFFFGASAGASLLSLNSDMHESGTHLGLSFPNFKIGKMINQNSALLLLLPGTVYSYDVTDRKRHRGFEAILPSYQYWINGKTWILGGAGIALDAPAFYDIEDASERSFHFGFGSAIALGYELSHFGNKTIDLQTRLHYGSVSIDSDQQSGIALSLLLGINLY